MNDTQLTNILRFCTQNTLASCCRANKRFYGLSLPILLRKPRFGSYGMGALDTFELLLKVLSEPHQRIGSHILQLDLSGIDETMYKSIPKDWLAILVKTCRCLIILDLSKTNFVTSLHFGFNGVHPLKSLNLNNASISAQVVPSLIRVFPNLVQLSLQNATFVGDSLMKLLSLECTNLVHLDISGTGVTTQGLTLLLYSLSLRTLYMNSCSSLSDDHSIWSLCRAPLTVLSARSCPTFTDAFLIALCSSPMLVKTLKHLDVSGCPKMTFSLDSSFPLFAKTFGPSLLHLSLSFTPIDKQRESKPDILDTFAQFKELTRLTFSDIVEETPNNIIWTLGSTTLPRLNALNLIRSSYSSDFIVTKLYTNVESSHLVVDEVLVKKFNGLYGERCTMILDSIEEFGNNVSVAPLLASTPFTFV